jgi:SMC interacting uncharacterized protein involved in chromosome segregation
VSELRTRWRRLSADLSTRRAQFQQCLDKWGEYEKEYDKISAWLAAKETQCSQLIALRENVDTRQECLDKSQVSLAP